MAYTDRADSSNAKLIVGMAGAIAICLLLFFLFFGFGASVSQEEYESLHNGMAYEEAVAIIGGQGRIVMDMDAMGMRMRTYQWHGPGTSTVVLSFEGDRLVAKIMAA